jgi:copper(I)-binding protein
MKTLLIAAGLALAATPALAAASHIQASLAWSRPAAAGGTGAGFLTLANKGAAADALVGASSPMAAKVELHSSAMQGGMMHMAMTPSAPLPAGGQLTLAPGGRHLMFLGLKKALKIGDKLPATLRFASGATLKVEFAVRVAPPRS